MSTSVSRVPLRALAALVALVMVASMVAIAPAAQSQEETEPGSDRIAGEDRFETAAETALETYPDAEDVIVAAGFNFPDALAAGGLSGLVEAPILLVNDVRDEATQHTLDALDAIDPETVHIAGGPVAVSESIREELEAEGWSLNEFSGDDRFDTAALMAEVFEPAEVDTAVVATGRTAADALSVGPLAHMQAYPVLLTEVDELPEFTADALADLGLDEVIVVGGPVAVSDDVVSAIEDAADADAIRVAGATRQETSVEIADFHGDLRSSDEVLLATGWGPETTVPTTIDPDGVIQVPADALSAAPYGGATASPTLLVNDVQDRLDSRRDGQDDSFLSDYLQDQCALIDWVTVFGGPQAVADSVQDAGVEAATCEVAPTQLTLVNAGHLHGHATNWDYINDQPYPEGEERGVARISSLVNEVREDRGEEQTLLFDTGDTLQGTPLTHYFQRHEPFTETGVEHPMAKVINHVGWDAWAAGNHEWDFGLDLLDAFAEQVDAPMLGANVIDVETGEPAYEPYSIHTVEIEGQEPIDVALLGLTTPGVAVFNRHHVEGELEFVGGVETAAEYVPELQEQADVVLVAIHSGVAESSGYDPDEYVGYPENFGEPLAREVPGIDVVLAGHTSERSAWVENEETGEDVLVAMKGFDGSWSNIIDLYLTEDDGEWTVINVAYEEVDAGDYDEDPEVVDLVDDDIQEVRDWLGTPIGFATEELPLADALIRDVPAIDWMNIVQLDEVEAALEGTDDGNLPVLSGAPPLDTSLGLPEGELTLGDVFNTYRFENNVLKAVRLTGDEVIDYLEWSVGFHDTLEDAGPHESIGGSAFFFAPAYPLEMEFDLGQEPGDRVVRAEFEGEQIDEDDEFVFATTNYNINSAGGAPHLPNAEIVYSEFRHGADLLVEWVQENEVVDPTDDWRIENWQFTVDGEPLIVE